MKMLNIACGNRYHKDWINIDFNSTSNLVKKINILNGLPFDDNSFDFIYCGHFIEHLHHEDVENVLLEIKRVLKKGGIFRVVVPDLENICREYLENLELVKKDEIYHDRYRWIVIELLDQMVRAKGGGKMLEFFKYVKSSKNRKLADYIFKRTGDKLLEENFLSQEKGRKISLNYIKNNILEIYLKFIKILIPYKIRKYVFIDSDIGEKHLWMYDAYSIKKLLEEIGFIGISFKTFNTSDIPNFNKYLLDINEDGTPYKGISSIYVETRK